MKAHSLSIDASFVAVSDGLCHALVRAEWEGSIAPALLRGEGCSTVASAGRGAIQRFTFERRTGLIRMYRRGGVIGPLLQDRMFFVNRPLRELRLLVALHAAGLPVPSPLGARWARTGCVYRGAIAAEELAAQHLQQFLRETPHQASKILPVVGATVRRFHDLGLYHADLQVRNILVGDSGVYLIDFDRARLYPSLSSTQRLKNLLRLRRSFEKNSFPAIHFDAVCEGYGTESLPRWIDRAYRVKGRISDRLQGREAPRP